MPLNSSCLKYLNSLPNNAALKIPHREFKDEYYDFQLQYCTDGAINNAPKMIEAG